MAYTSRYAGPDLTAEEREVQAALRGYSSSGAARTDWVPTSALWQAYCAWRLQQHQRRFDPDRPPKLTINQFGRALRRVFPGIERHRRESNKRARTYGYLGLRSI